MAGEPIVTLVGNVTGGPELRFTNAGKAVASFTLAVNNRVKKGDQWEDGEPTWVRCSVWEGMAENVAESIQKGVRVIVQGALTTRAWEKDGEKRTGLELRVDAIGPDLRFATAVVTRVGSGSGGGTRRQTAADAGHTTNDPWATAGPDSEPPF